MSAALVYREISGDDIEDLAALVSPVLEYWRSLETAPGVVSDRARRNL